MTTVSNTDLSFLKQINTQLGQYSQFGGLGEVSSWSNSIFTIQNDFENISNGNSQQQSAGIQNLVNHVMSIVSKITDNRKAEAQRTANANTKQAVNTVNAQEKNNAKIVKAIEDVTSAIEGNTDNVEGLISNLTELVGNLSEQSEKVKELKEKIEAKQEELKNAKTPEEKKAILEEIKGICSELKDAIKIVNEIKEQTETQEEEVQNIQLNTEEKLEEGAKVQLNGQNESQNIANQFGQAGTATAKEGIEAGRDKIEGIAFESAANSSSALSGFTFGLSGAEGVKLQLAATDRFAASGIGQSAVTLNYSTIGQGLGSLNQTFGALANFENALGGLNESFGNVLGEWGEIYSPAITSLGSYSNLESTTETLTEAADQDIQRLNSLNGNNQNEDSTELATNNTDLSAFDEIEDINVA